MKGGKGSKSPVKAAKVKMGGNTNFTAKGTPRLSASNEKPAGKGPGAMGERR